MTEHGILFTGAMVRALLRGEKTVTRRTSKTWLKVRKGDTLWVRETWHRCPHCTETEWAQEEHGRDVPRRYNYRATANAKCLAHAWTSPIHLPRKLSRITLRATADAYLQRLGDMTDEDADAEGFGPWTRSTRGAWEAAEELVREKLPRKRRDAALDRLAYGAFTPLDAFRVAWEALHGAWDPEQRVVVLPFEVVP